MARMVTGARKTTAMKERVAATLAKTGTRTDSSCTVTSTLRLAAPREGYRHLVVRVGGRGRGDARACGPEGAVVHSPVDKLTPLPAPLRAPILTGRIEIRRLTTSE
jgi:hypothetical protein